MLTKPVLLLRVEAATVFAVALFFYRSGHYPWWLFAVLFLVPDLSMLPYLINVPWGTVSYNLVHTISLPLILLLAALILPAPSLVPYALIWVSHIALDRMLGFGLKYPTAFKDTHLQRV